MADDLPPTFAHAPPLDPAWLAYERSANLLRPKPAIDDIERQPLYAAQCRQLNAAMMAPGARDHPLSQGIETQSLSVPSNKDGYPIPVLQYDRGNGTEPEVVLIYYHGGGLLVGEADSEDLSCRRLVKESTSFLPGSLRLYSVGYRLKPQHPGSTCLSDSIDAFVFLATKTHPSATVIVVGSSSGGQLAALVTQHALKAGMPLHGALLRCPVTSDAAFRERREDAHFPAGLREMHTSAHDPSFATSLLGRLNSDPREGLNKMPLEAEAEDLKDMPRTWVQVCTNDALYSDGACYARVLRDAGVQVRTNVVVGWPHTFWLKAPGLERALEAESAMIEGLAWAAGVQKRVR